MDNMEVAKRIKSLREKMHLTQNKFAKLLHLHRSTICLWEKGKRYPSTRHSLSLAFFLWKTTEEEVDFNVYKNPDMPVFF